MTASEQSRADAVADAETLRLEWERKALSPSLSTDARPHFSIRFALIPPELEDYYGALYAARAAFRAIPGLREGRP